MDPESRVSRLPVFCSFDFRIVFLMRQSEHFAGGEGFNFPQEDKILFRYEQ